MVDTSIFTTRADPIELGEHRQLFLDDGCLEETAGVARRMHQPRKCGPVLTPDPDCGTISLQSRSVPQWNPEKDLWEWWYWGSYECEPWGRWHSTSISHTHYAVSSDGENWECPNLGLYEWQGSRDNNLATDPELGHRTLYHIIRDEHDPDPARRYKGLFSVGGRKPAVSPDGFDWTFIETDTIPSSDESHFCYDEQSGLYVAMVKQGTVWGRSVFLATSEDFQEWTAPQMVLHADDTDWANRMPRVRAAAEDPAYLTPPLLDDADYIAETYQMAILPYQGLYVGFPCLFNPAGRIPPPQTNHTGLNQTELAVSRDLRHWRRLCDRELFLGIEPWDGQTYDTAQLLPCGGPVVRQDEIWVYYNACRFRGHQGLYADEYAPYFKDLTALALAKLRLDGFVSLDADAGGEVLTKVLAPSGPELYVNVDAPNGSLRAEVLDAETLAPLPGLSRQDCLPVRGDNLRARVGWQGGRNADADGRPVRLRFILENASFYSFWTGS